MSIKELIEYLEKDIKFFENPEFGHCGGNRLISYKIALAALQAHEQGMVLVPSEPTEEMIKGVEYKCEMKRDNDGKITVIETRGFDLEKAIQARPITPFDKLLEELR